MKSQGLAGRHVTEWLVARACEPSGFTGGSLCSNRDWCEHEVARFKLKGVPCVVKEKTVSGRVYVAVFR